MRLAFLILLLANGILFFWGQGYLDDPAAGREPERIGRQKTPGQLRILPADTAPLPAAPPKPVLACKRIEGLGNDETASLRDVLGTLPDWQFVLTPQPQEPAHWVVIPSLASRALADRKKNELRDLGFKESEVVETANLGPYAVSLGVFRERQRADEFLLSLTKKGVRSARIGERALSPEKFSLELRAPAAMLNAKLPDLMAMLPQARVQSCTPP